MKWNFFKKLVKKKDSLQYYYFECQCSSSDHILRFVYDSIENELYTEILISHYRNFFLRIITAIKYIFKQESNYGHYDCWLLKQEDTKKLIKLLQKVK